MATFPRGASGHSDTTTCLRELALTLYENGGFAEAERLCREAIEATTQRCPTDDWRVAVLCGQPGECLTRLGRFEEAESILLESLSAIVAANGEVPRARLKAAYQRLIDLYAGWGKSEQAAEWRAKLTPTQPALQPTSQPAKSSSQS